jgi:5'-phosphate synthase pdxT subunit
MKIGVLALQGDFREHIKILTDLGVDAVEVRLPQDLLDLDGLIIPGGESTTIGKLATKYDLMDPLEDFARDHAIWGTCAGMIFMAKDIGVDQPLLGIMDIVVERNAFGRQLESFVIDLQVPSLNDGLDAPFSAVFIRAPRLAGADEAAGVTILAKLDDGTAVAAEQGHWLVTSFHPELTGDSRFHSYFITLVKKTLAAPDLSSQSAIQQ